MKFNKYKSYKSVAQGNYTIEDWIDLLKGSNETFKNTVLKGRTYPKTKNQSDPYNKTKASLPCITYNFLFKDGQTRANKRVESSTGLLFFDIDEVEFDINSIDKSNIYLSHKSYGGKGYTVIVRVEGLTLDNYKDTVNCISKQIGIFDVMDTGARKATQCTVLSYDPDLFFNEEANVFQATNTTPELDFDTKMHRSSNASVISNKKVHHSQHKKGLKESIYVGNDAKLRFDNLNEIEIPEGKDYIYIREGIDWVCCTAPWGKSITEKRGNFLLSYCNNLVWLNPNATRESIKANMDIINKKKVMPSVEDRRLNGIVDSILKYKDAGTLEPHVNPKKRKYVYRNKTERADMNRIMNEERSMECQQRIYDSIEDWNFEDLGKISQRKVAKESGVGLTTVIKHWHQYKSFAEELNEEFKPKKKKKMKEQKEEGSNLSSPKVTKKVTKSVTTEFDLNFGTNNLEQAEVPTEERLFVVNNYTKIMELLEAGMGSEVEEMIAHLDRDLFGKEFRDFRAKEMSMLK